MGIARPAAGLMLLLAIAVAPAPAGAEDETYSDDKLDAFVAATIAVESAARRWIRVIESAESEEIANDYRRQASEELKAAVEMTEGISPEEYAAIMAAARADRALAARLEALYLARIPQ